MRQTLILSLAAAATLAVCGTASAQPDPRGDRGQALTRDALEQRTAEAFGRMDINDDGVLNRADREAREKEVFARVDADSNGSVSFEEFAALRDQRAERAEAGPRPQRGGPPLAGRPGPMGPGLPGMARAADADRDGAISAAEFQTAVLARFDSVDADRDGTISDVERREQFRERLRERFGDRGPRAG